MVRPRRVIRLVLVLLPCFWCASASAQTGEVAVDGETEPEDRAEPEDHTQPEDRAEREGRAAEGSDAGEGDDGGDFIRGRVAPRAPVQRVDWEVPVPPTEPRGASLEISMAFAPTFGFGLGGLGGLAGSSGLAGLSVAGRTDFAFAASSRVFLGLGLSIEHVEQPSSATGNLNCVEVPLVAQVYFEDPSVGAAVPTLRIMPAFQWEEQTGTSMGMSIATRAAAGGRLSFGIGVTWFVMRWLALRFLGDVGASAILNYQGPNGNSVNVFVAADIGLVVRM